MPTESAFFLAGLLFIAAALGYFFAKFGDTDDDDVSSGQLSSDYLKGLNYVLNEESDRAVEVFTRIAELDDDSLETHFALGSLFRKRGEIDRAIRVHENLIARPALSSEQRFQAEAALADDFLSAGLFDRAESMFLTLCDSPEYRLEGQERLRQIYEVTRDWERAIEISRTIAESGRSPPGDRDLAESIAHYFCELAAEAWLKKDARKARSMLRQAESSAPAVLRSRLLAGDFFRDEQNYKKAISLYREVIAAAPDLLVEVLPRLAACHRESDSTEDLSGYLRGLLDGEAGEQVASAVAMAAVRDPEIRNPEALQALTGFVAANGTLAQLTGIVRIEALDPGQRQDTLEQVRAALRAIVMARPGYICGECGYTCLVMQWQCPGCRQWDTIRPVLKINLVSAP